MAKENGGVIGVLNTPSTTTASGVWALQDQYEAKRNGNWPLTPFVSPNSLRFNSGSSDYLNRTFGTATNRKIFTFSVWVKRSTLSVDNGYLMAAGTDASTNVDEFYLRSGDTLDFNGYESSVTQFQLRTTQLFRDVSAWYHLMIAYDSTQATSSNRIKMYVNGSQVTAFAIATYPSLNFEPLFNSATAHTIARNLTSGSRYQDGYFSEYNFIDGQALTPSSFGASNASGVWYPIPYAGSYGTNGFNLKFTNASSLGTDSSPNGNNFTVNNLTSVDQSTDTELNNFATLNAVDNSSVTLSQGNLSASCASPSGCRSTIGVTTGKWYIEIKYQNTTSMCGVVAMEQAVTTQAIGATIFGQSGGSAPELFLNGSGTSDYNNATAFTANDIMQIALDMDSNTVYFGLNGSWFDGTSWNSASPNTGHSLTSGYTYGFRASTGSGTSVNIWNFGSPPYAANSYADGAGYGNFSYAVPSGYYALCTANLNTYG